MPYNIVMPQLGLTMTEGSVSSWLKKPGEPVKKGEMLFTVETDKVEMEVESPVAGYMGAVLLEPRKTVPTGTLIAVIVDSLDEIAGLNAVVETGQGRSGSVAQATPSVPSTPESPPEALQSRTAGKDQFPVSPRARRLAEQLGIDIRRLKPVRGRRIVEEDVKRFHERQSEDSDQQTG
jgi:pyruvate dehydrogenase E2 component (dihydrolipoamide acetyltransferase)